MQKSKKGGGAMHQLVREIVLAGEAAGYDDRRVNDPVKTAAKIMADGREEGYRLTRFEIVNIVRGVISYCGDEFIPARSPGLIPTLSILDEFARMSNAIPGDFDNPAELFINQEVDSVNIHHFAALLGYIKADNCRWGPLASAVARTLWSAIEAGDDNVSYLSKSLYKSQLHPSLSDHIGSLDFLEQHIHRMALGAEIGFFHKLASHSIRRILESSDEPANFVSHFYKALQHRCPVDASYINLFDAWSQTPVWQEASTQRQRDFASAIFLRSLMHNALRKPDLRSGEGLESFEKQHTSYLSSLSRILPRIPVTPRNAVYMALACTYRNLDPKWRAAVDALDGQDVSRIIEKTRFGRKPDMTLIKMAGLLDKVSHDHLRELKRSALSSDLGM